MCYKLKIDQGIPIYVCVDDNPNGNIDEENEETETICIIFRATMLTFAGTGLKQQTITLKF
jgi:hypothetical protein